MSFSILFDLVEEFYSTSNLIELNDIYYRFFTPEGNKVINVNYALKNWCDEVADLYDVPDNYFRKAWIKDILCDFDQTQELLDTIKHYKEQFDEAQT